MTNEGATFYFDRSPKDVRAALDATLTEIGYVRAKEQSGVEVRLSQSEGGLCARMDTTKAQAISLARRLARRLARPVRVFTARLVTDDPIDCAVDELMVGAEGAPRQGRWGVVLTEEYGDDWSQLCDGKSYFAVSAILDEAVETVLGDEHEGVDTFHLAPPPSLGEKRLDEIAKQVRLADDAMFTTIGGRPSVRVRNSGATITSFVTPAEAEILRSALGSLLPAR